MSEELKRFEGVLHQLIGVSFECVTPEKECMAYAGYNFQIGSKIIKFRKAKITPKKTGQFVTLWKRNAFKQTEQFHETDEFDFCFIVVEQDDQYAVLVFSKSVLKQRRLISSSLGLGKRGFRVYPDWVITENSQTRKTQDWQSDYLINLSSNDLNVRDKLKSLLNLC